MWVLFRTRSQTSKQVIILHSKLIKVRLSRWRWFAALNTLLDYKVTIGFIFIFQYRIKWNMCLSLLYPNSMLCKSFNKKRRFKNKLFFLLWIENISNNNRKYQTFLYFYHNDVDSRLAVGLRQNPSICQFYKNKVLKLSHI